MQIGIIGLGKMGSRIAEKLVLSGHDVVVWNRTSSSAEELKLKVKNEKLKVAETIEELAKELTLPRSIWLMLPSGEPTQTVLDEVVHYVVSGDIVIDGANSHYKDTQRRYEKLKTENIKYLGVGVSGGIIAEKEGYPMMVGGDHSAYLHIKPLLDSLATPHGGHAYFGSGGAGHFVKMVHNGIEYGMMQAIGEGFGVLEKSQYDFDLLEVAKIWQKGTIVSSFLIDRAKDALEKDKNLSDIVGVINATGEAEWTITEAKKEKVPVPVIEESLAFRRKSNGEMDIQNSFAAKMVAALRREFGGHSIVKSLK